MSEPWMPSDDAITDAVRESMDVGYEPIRALIRESVEKALAEERARDSERFMRYLLDMRNVEGELCRGCGGVGVKAYGSTATWHGGIGGQMITSDVCDKCWGSGDAARPWPNLRSLEAERKAEHARHAREVEKARLEAKIETLAQVGGYADRIAELRATLAALEVDK